MTREDIEAHWEMVLFYRPQVLQRIQDRAIEGGTQLRFERGALIDAFTTCRDYSALASRFNVSVSSIHDALSRLVLFARKIEYRAMVGSAGAECRFLVMTPVTTRAEADTLCDLMNAKGYDSTVEELD